MNLKQQLAYRDAFLNYLASDYDSWAEKAQLIQAAQKLRLPSLAAGANQLAREYDPPELERMK